SLALIRLGSQASWLGRSGCLSISSATVQSTLLGAVRASNDLKKSGRSSVFAGIPPYILGSSLSTTILLRTLKAASWFLLDFKMAKASPCNLAVILRVIMGITAASQLSFARARQGGDRWWERAIATLPGLKGVP